MFNTQPDGLALSTTAIVVELLRKLPTQQRRAVIEHAIAELEKGPNQNSNAVMAAIKVLRDEWMKV